MIPWDLERTPLQIKTNSTVYTDMIFVGMYNKDNTKISYVFVRLSSAYYIGDCSTTYTHLPVKPPEEVEKIWTIAKTETAIIITCNGVEVLNYLFTDSLYSDCVSRLGGDVVAKIKFISIDTASNSFRAGMGVN